MRQLGLGNAIRAVRFAFYRWRVDPKARQAHGPGRGPTTLHSVKARTGGARFSFGDIALDVRLLKDGGVFVGWDDAKPLPSYALPPGSAGPEYDNDCTVKRVESGWVLSGCGVQVGVDASGYLTFRTASGDVIRRDAPPRWQGAAWSHRTERPTGAIVCGLGGRSGNLDRTGRTYRLWNTDPQSTYAVGDDPLSLSVPVYMVVAGSGCSLAFYDNSFDGAVEVAEGIDIRLSGGPLRYYVFHGEPHDVLERYTALTGRPALPPRWALGFHQSRWGYDDQHTVRRIAEQFKEHDLPLSAIWLDIDHLYRQRPFVIDEGRFPDLSGLVAGLAVLDIHLVSIVDPGLARTPGVEPYASGADLDLFCRVPKGDIVKGVVWPGEVAFPDFTAERARLWWGHLYENYLKHGVSGFWHDMNEPSSFAAWGDGTLPRSTRHEFDGRGGDHTEAHNVYALLMNRSSYEALRDQRPGRRPYLLSRSGFAGLQRYAGTWTGDIGTAWEGVRNSLAFTLGLACSGIPYSGPDIGGFDRQPTSELYTRWFQLAAWLPFFRVHCASLLPGREPWTWDTRTLRAVRTAMRHRYELLPYWYSLAWQAHLTGAPYVRPMFWVDLTDDALRGVDDQFMLGEAFLVAPVVQEGARERKVRLPRGTWCDWRTGEVHKGPDIVTLQAPLETTPVLVRAGAVVPIERNGRLELQACAPSGDVPITSTLFTDEGDGYLDPVEEHFAVAVDADGNPFVSYTGPAKSLPYPVNWLDGQLHNDGAEESPSHGRC